MKKAFLVLLALFCSYGFNGHILEAATGKYEIKTSEAKLTIDQKGNLKVIQNNGQIIQINTSINNLWKIVLKNEQNNREYLFKPLNNYTISNNNSIIRITVNNFYAEGKALPVEAEFTISVKDDAFCFSGSLKSEFEDWIFKELDYPNISGIQLKNEKADIYWPNGLGQFYDDPVSFGSRSLRYPDGGEASMPWLSLNKSGYGLYFGVHDTLHGVKVFNLSYIELEKVFKANINTPIFWKEYAVPDIMLKLYNGSWYKASNYYRSWFDKHFQVASAPAWVQDDSGWILAILKQQNLEVMWPYKDIDKLCDIAEQLNLGTIGLFGWGPGGHDKYYPNYMPDNLMGGREELINAIKRAHMRGIKIIIYANGIIMDTSTDYYKYNGSETILVNEDGRPVIQHYIKQTNETPVIFAQACLGSNVWCKTMFDLALQAKSLGADGILYDQIGCLDPELCFSKNHNHQPGQSDVLCRLKIIHEIKDNMKKIDPDFSVMVESTNDAVIREVNHIFGLGTGTSITQNSFTELYRYTFPELLEMQRNTNPMITRTDANFAAIYGLKHEIECRYPEDVEYLLDGTIPTNESYSNVASPPSLTKMNLLPAEEVTKYVHLLIEFEKSNSDFFRTGKFIDEEGIEIKGKDIIVKGFKNGKRIGVVVWNRHLAEKRDFSVSVPGFTLVKASEPGKTEVVASSPLNANSLRLLVYERN